MVLGIVSVVILGILVVYFFYKCHKGIVITCPNCGSDNCEVVTEVYKSKVKSKETGKVKEAITFSYVCNHCGSIRTVANIPVDQEDITEE